MQTSTSRTRSSLVFRRPAERRNGAPRHQSQRRGRNQHAAEGGHGPELVGRCQPTLFGLGHPVVQVIPAEAVRLVAQGAQLPGRDAHLSREIPLAQAPGSALVLREPAQAAGEGARHEHRRGAVVQRPAQLLERPGGATVDRGVGHREALHLGPTAEVPLHDLRGERLAGEVVRELVAGPRQSAQVVPDGRQELILRQALRLGSFAGHAQLPHPGEREGDELPHRRRIFDDQEIRAVHPQMFDPSVRCEEVEEALNRIELPFRL